MTDDDSPMVLLPRLFHVVLLRRQTTLKFHAFRTSNEKLHSIPTAQASDGHEGPTYTAYQHKREVSLHYGVLEERCVCLLCEDVKAKGSIWVDGLLCCTSCIVIVLF